jgi:CBS domain-containing protein
MVKKLLYDPNKLKIKDFVISDEYEVVEDKLPVKEAISELLKMNRGVLLIKDKKGEIEGVVTDRKILKKLIESDKPFDLTVRDIMDTHILSVEDTEKLKHAMEEIRTKKPAAVIVKNHKGDFKGYFSPVDFQEAEKIIREGAARAGEQIPSEEE